MPEIRVATNADVSALLELVKAYWTFEGIPGYDPALLAPQLRRVLDEPRLGCGWIALEGGMAAGYLVVLYVFSLEHLGPTAEIDEFFVRPECRGRGIGSGLLRRAETEVIRAGCTRMSLQLGRSNEHGRRFYSRHGFARREGFELLVKQLGIV